MRTLAISFAAASLALVASCSPAPDEEADATVAAEEKAAATTDDSAMEEASGTATPPTTATSLDGRTLALEGLGDLTIGRPVPDGSSFAERGAQIGDECRTVSSPDYPGVYAITQGKNGAVRRITVGQRSPVKLIEGIGVGSTEKAVLGAFPGFRASPHKYVDAPAKYLTQPGNDPRLHFEIGADGRVSLIHVGTMPHLAYVEGCA